jgi:hypothetical protein
VEGGMTLDYEPPIADDLEPRAKTIKFDYSLNYWADTEQEMEKLIIDLKLEGWRLEDNQDGDWRMEFAKSMIERTG